MKSNNDHQSASQKSIVILNVVGMIIVLATWVLTQLIMQFFNIDLGKLSFFLGGRTFLLIFFLLLILPLSIFGEWWLSQWRKRKFLWKGVLTIIGVFGVFIMVDAFILTMLDTLLSELTWTWQMPLVAVSNVIGLLTMAILIKNAKFKKWREELGW